MLRIDKISKFFPGVKALDKVSVEFGEGEIHAVLGENGAGKSTLIKIICGVLQPDEGEMYLDGKGFKVQSFIDALRKGVSIVNQELQIFPELSIAENIMLDKMTTIGVTGMLNWKKINENAEKYLKMVGLDNNPTNIMDSLSIAQRRMVEIAKALASDSKILLLDEPTSPISGNEAKRLFELLFELKNKGIIILFVTHKLEEVFMICNKVTVLRDGKLIGTENINEVDKHDLVKMMIGREEKFGSFINQGLNKNERVLEVKNLVKKNKAENITFNLKKGEILGLYGLVGSGRTELARLIIGLDKKDSGDIFINGKKVEPKSINDTLYKYKTAYITENRKEEGLFLNSSVMTNISITIWSKIASKILRFVNNKMEADIAKTVINNLDIKTTGLYQIVNNLSGGNQQKVSIGKWLITDCDILVFDEPTVGIDVGAREYIHELIFNLAKDEKKSIILISSDMLEIIKLSNRIIVFRDKKIVGEIDDLNKYNNDYEIISKKVAECYHDVN